MNGITADQVLSAAAVLLSLMGAAVAVGNFAEVIRRWRAPGKAARGRTDENTRRLEAHEKAIRTLQEGQQALCAGVVALLEHEMHDGSPRKMSKARDQIDAYLNGLIRKNP